MSARNRWAPTQFSEAGKRTRDVEPHGGATIGEQLRPAGNFQDAFCH
jgi:hypothetical protein